MELYHYFSGTLPLIVNIPHAGTYVPPAILERFTGDAKRLPDTDWHVERLYAFVRDLGAHMLVATHSRYVVDLNRATDGQSLYPGKFTTGLCPLTLFDGTPVYHEGKSPDEKEVNERIEAYWRPYHLRLQTLVDEVKSRTGGVVLFDAHSIGSQIPKLFDGTLPDLNIGTADGASASPAVTEPLLASVRSSHYSVAYNGRFKGGYITRHYGQPAQGVQAIQLELAQKNYMQETYPFTYDETKAQCLQTALKALLAVLAEKRA
jgi:N-formylglutamate deformylase